MEKGYSDDNGKENHTGWESRWKERSSLVNGQDAMLLIW